MKESCVLFLLTLESKLVYFILAQTLNSTDLPKKSIESPKYSAGKLILSFGCPAPNELVVRITNAP
jgi:hypothetical protein